MAKLVEMVKNSPLVRRKLGGYAVLEQESKDPFVKGIDFSAHYLATAQVTSRNDSPELQEKVKEICIEARKVTKSLRKIVLTVKSTTLVVKDVGTQVTDTYPIFLVAYCGAHREFDNIFFFIHKTQLEKKFYVEIFTVENAAMVKAVTLTISKAFNIAYKAWMCEKRQKERSDSLTKAGSQSPLVQRKNPGNGQPSSLAKMAPGVAKPAGTYTPPPPRKVEEPEAVGRARSGSAGEQQMLKNPALKRVIAKNEKTGSTHDVVLTDDFDTAFQQLAESRVNRPDVLRTSLAIEDTDSFNLDAIKAYIDKEAIKEESQ